jgi:DNA-binding response OmpR family regulator
MKKRKIIIADDEEDILHFMKYFLESSGYEVQAVINGKGLIEMSAMERPDLYLLDLSMSGIDGRDICRGLKNAPRTSGIPVILVSAHPEIQQIAVECRADNFVAKPFDISDLLATIKNHLQD